MVPVAARSVTGVADPPRTRQYIAQGRGSMNRGGAPPTEISEAPTAEGTVRRPSPQRCGREILALWGLPPGHRSRAAPENWRGRPSLAPHQRGRPRPPGPRGCPRRPRTYGFYRAETGHGSKPRGVGARPKQGRLGSAASPCQRRATGPLGARRLAIGLAVRRKRTAPVVGPEGSGRCAR